MKLCGVIAEYNPFHNGHAHHLGQARALSGCDWLIVCMAGGVVQRGEVALLDKWTRARMALAHGADLVVELPALFAVRPAEAFARGGVMTLAAMGVDALSFGCETDDLELLRRAARLLAAEDEALSGETRRGLAAGLTHARARGEAVERRLGLPEGFLNRPNTALALEYLKALDGVGRETGVCLVPREGDYHGEALGRFAGASAIRAAALRERGAEAARAMPPDCFEAMESCLGAGRFARTEALDQALLFLLRGAKPDELAALCDAGEGLERLFIRRAGETGAREALIRAVKSKRYTYARLSRFCAQAMLNLTRDAAQAHPVPEYLRALGFRRDAAPLLRHLKETAALPFVTDAMRLKGNGLFRFDCAATDLQALATASPEARATGQDFTHPIVIV
ncbi:MAG: nucleotidyltransferase family protein [Clostridia bacterium]|nr:nucleotidyltransferase family protein [Clostridia bacterium]